MPPTPTYRPGPVALRCDATVAGGVGHLVRQLALAEELLSRGHAVRLFGRVDVPWVAEQARRAGVGLEAADPDPAGFAAQVRAAGAAACVIDGYLFGRGLGSALRAAGVAVMAFCDGEFGLDQEADVYVDQNLGAAAPVSGIPPTAVFLAGLDYVLLRDAVTDRRDSGGATAPETPQGAARPPRVLAVFGGTDPYGSAEVVVPLILAAGLPVEVVAVAARPDTADALRALPLGPGQRLQVRPPVDDLPGLALTCAAAVSAAGTSTWEFLCLGVPTGLVCVVDNQRVGYQAATRSACLPVGRLKELRGDEAARAASVGVLRRLVGDPALRQDLTRRGRDLVDGRGAERVADALERLAAGLR